MFGIVAGIGGRLEAVQDIDFRFVREQAAGGEALAKVGDEEDSRACRPQRRRRLVEADPIGVGLDHGAAASGRGDAGKGAPIVGKRAEIDGEAPGGARRRGLVHICSSTPLSHEVALISAIDYARAVPSRQSPYIHRCGASLSPLSLAMSLGAR